MTKVSKKCEDDEEGARVINGSTMIKKEARELRKCQIATIPYPALLITTCYFIKLNKPKLFKMGYTKKTAPTKIITANEALPQATR